MNLSPEHVHLLLNHVPVLGTVFALLLLAWGRWREHDAVVRAALGTFVVVALVAVPVYLTGEGAEEAVEGFRGVSEAVIESHEEMALLALIAAGALGAWALVGLVSLRERIPRRFATATLVVALVPMVLLGLTAYRGGQIRHSEVRPGGSVSAAGEDVGSGTLEMPGRRAVPAAARATGAGVRDGAPGSPRGGFCGSPSPGMGQRGSRRSGALRGPGERAFPLTAFRRTLEGDTIRGSFTTHVEDTGKRFTGSRRVARMHGP